MKNRNLKKYLIVVLILLQSGLVWSQDGAVDFDSSIPSPSAMSTYQDIPVDYCTGIPNISYGLLNLPTASKDLSFNLAVSYHPNNTTVNCKVSDVGQGWNWFGVPTISKNIKNVHDEVLSFDDFTQESAPTALNDIYYYSINGESGKFKFVYDYSTAAVSIKMLSPTLLKFSFTSASTESLRVDSFQVTDANGIIYNFQKYDIVKIGSATLGTASRTNFHLTTAYDSNNTQLCSISYDEVYSELGPVAGEKVASVNKINEITATGVGKIKFHFTTNTSLINKNFDLSKLNHITLLTLTNSQIKKCSFDYYSGRKLRSISFIGSNSTVVENYNFEYRETTGTAYDGGLVLGTDLVKKHDRFGFVHTTNRCSIADLAIPKSTLYSNKNTVATGILEKVTLPTGGIIVYDFEANEVDPDGYELQSYPYFYSTNNGDDFNESLLGEQNTNTFEMKPLDPDNWIYALEPHTEDYYLVTLGSSNYSVTATDTGRFFQVTQDTELFIRFNGYPNSSPLVPDNELNMGFQIKSGATVIGSYMVSNSSTACVNLSPKINLTTGWYTIHITSLNGGSVNYTMYARRKNAVPKTNYYAGGVRIKAIKNYENKNSTTPIKSVSFEYNDFNTPERSSGHIYFKELGRNVDTHQGFDPFVLYKNVKVIEEGNGFSKYFFYIPRDMASPTEVGESYYFKILKGGLLYKRELYNSLYNLLEADTHYYDLAISDPEDESLNDYLRPQSSLIVKDYYIKKKYTKTEKYLLGTAPSVLKSVTINNSWNFKPESITVFDSQNKKQKTRYYYLNEVPTTPNASSLTAKNLLSSPLVVEQYYDGVLMSKAKSEFDSFGNGLFKKAKSYVAKGTGDYTLEQRVSKVDNVSNKVLEVTNDKGSFTSYIWGYNKTQPVAKIENMAYSGIPSELITAIQGAANEAALQAALLGLRGHNSLANAMVTTYTYQPLIGILSVTDPKGDKVTYHYDTFNRLSAVKDRNGNLLTENHYYFRPQN